MCVARETGFFMKRIVVNSSRHTQFIFLARQPDILGAVVNENTTGVLHTHTHTRVLMINRPYKYLV